MLTNNVVLTVIFFHELTMIQGLKKALGSTENEYHYILFMFEINSKIAKKSRVPKTCFSGI